MKLIRVFQVKTKDVDLAERSFGPEMVTIKGKKIRKRPNPIDDHRI